MVKKQRRHTTAFKSRIALESLEGSKTFAQLFSKHDLHANPDSNTKTTSPEQRTQRQALGMARPSISNPHNNPRPIAHLTPIKLKPS